MIRRPTIGDYGIDYGTKSRYRERVSGVHGIEHTSDAMDLCVQQCGNNDYDRKQMPNYRTAAMITMEVCDD